MSEGPTEIAIPAPADSWLIATPIWREHPSDDEVAFLRRTSRSNAAVHRWFCAPASLDVGFYEQRFPDWRIRRFPNEVFSSVAAYSKWLTAPDFYREITEFEFVTICQLDAVLLRDVTDVDMSGIDYLGSPWVPPLKVLTPGKRIYVASEQGTPQGMWLTKRFGRSLRVGNGGLSIRRVEAHVRAAEWLTSCIPERYRDKTLEDVLLCAFAPRTGLRVARPEFAERIFMETGATSLEANPDVYGFHALWRWNPALAASLNLDAN